jgi:mRNA interferase HigB
MRLAGVDIIEEAQKRHADAAKRLSAWKTEVMSKTTVWKSFQDIRSRYPNTDKVGDRYVFDIGGNRFRLIVTVNFAVGVVRVRWFGTHAEYDKIKVEEV